MIQDYARRRRITGMRPSNPVAVKATVLGSGTVVGVVMSALTTV
jgi:hypothetical protein